MPEGCITFSTALDNVQLEKDLAKLKKSIEKKEQEISDMTQKRETAQQKGVLGAAELDAEKAKLQEIKDRLQDIRNMARDKKIDLETRDGLKAQIPAVQQELSDQQTRVRALQSEWNKTVSSVERYDQKIAEARDRLDQQKTTAGILVQEIEAAGQSSSGMGEAINQAGTYLDRFTDRIKKLMSRAFVFTIISSGLRVMREWMGKAIKTNSEAQAALAKLKGALLTLAQSLVNVLIPAFITLVNVLTKIAVVAANVMSKLFGTTVEQSAQAAENLNDEMNALEGVGDAAKDAGKSMASFDEINQISDGSAGTESPSAETAPDFSFMDSIPDELKRRLEEISEIVLFIGAGFALWKISGLLPGALGDIGSKLGLIMIAFAGLTLAINGITDAWNNGVDWLNMAEMIGGVVIAAIALYTAFGPIAAGLALIVGGLAMLAVGFHDVMENGWNLQNTLLTIAGILATGIGISLLVGSFIPALIAAIVGLLVGIAVATGHGEELIGGVKKVLEGFGKFFEGDFASGIALVLEGLTGIVGSIVDGVIDLVHGFFDWLDEKTGGQFHDVIQSIVGLFDMMVLGVREIFSGLIDFITGVFTGDWELAFNGLVTFMDGVAALLLAPILTAINFVIDGLNALIRGLNKISFDIPDWVPELGGKKFGFNIQPIRKFEIPALAQGAVIPPNREFLAVLGDQRSGTNIEAPADLIRQMVAEGIRAAMGSGGSGRDIHITLELDRRVFAKAVYKANSEESQRVGVSFAGV